MTAPDGDDVGGVIGRVANRLREAGVESPQVDAELLVGHVVGLPRSALTVERTRALTAVEQRALAELVERRARREPIQYVLGEWGFRTLTLGVDRRALIPRPETEVLVERALALLAGKEDAAVLDVGTGSGAIALAIAHEHHGARVLGIDSSADALSLARENAARCGLAVDFRNVDLFDGLPAGPWDIVVSNPPYVPAGDRGWLAPEVRDWEPAVALFDEGAAAAIARGAVDALAPGGAVVLEVGDGQAEAVSELLRSLGYAAVRVTRDLAGRDRVVEGTR